MSLRDSEILALAEAAHAHARRLDGIAVPAAAYTFAARVLRLRPTSLLLVLARDGVTELPAKPMAPAQTIAVSLLQPPGTRALSAIRATIGRLPLAAGSVDAVAEFAPSDALGVEADDEAVAILRELAGVLRPAGRYLCGGAPSIVATPSHASADKRRLDEWRFEGREVIHHTQQLVRPDGSWRRLHERIRLRSLQQSEALLRRAGLDVLNAFDGYAQKQPNSSTGPTILLCEKR